MKFWDSSAIVPLLIAEASTRHLLVLAAEDPAMLVWWGSEIECASALARLEREAAIDASAIVAAFSRLGQFILNPAVASRRGGYLRPGLQP